MGPPQRPFLNEIYDYVILLSTIILYYIILSYIILYYIILYYITTTTTAPTTTTTSTMMVIVIIADFQVLLMNLSIWDSGIGLINVSRAFPEL